MHAAGNPPFRPLTYECDTYVSRPATTPAASVMGITSLRIGADKAEERTRRATVNGFHLAGEGLVRRQMPQGAFLPHMNCRSH